MPRAASRDLIYYRRRYTPEVIELCVRWYLIYRLSYHDLAAMMAERDITVTDASIMRWVHRFVPEFERRWARFSKPTNPSWRMDETSVLVRGRWNCLYGAVDREGKSVHSLLCAERMIDSAQEFFRQAVRLARSTWPEKINLDGRYRYRFQGRGKMISLGCYPDVLSASPGARVRAARRLLDLGVDPAARRDSLPQRRSNRPHEYDGIKRTRRSNLELRAEVGTNGPRLLEPRRNSGFAAPRTQVQCEERRPTGVKRYLHATRNRGSDRKPGAIMSGKHAENHQLRPETRAQMHAHRCRGVFEYGPHAALQLRSHRVAVV